MLHHADLFALHTDVGLQLLARGALSFRDRELAVLRIAWLCQAPYEWGEHVMVGKRFGLTSDDIARVIDGPDAQGLDDELARWRLQVIDERLADAQEIPTLSELAALCKLSVRQLARGFRASRGCSIGDYVANSRIERAKRLLASDQSIKTIGYALGFNSSSGFCFAIRRATGMTPGEFRASGAARAA